MASRSDGILGEDDLFFALVIFVSQIRIFTNLGRFGEGLGEGFASILGRFWRIREQILESFEKHMTCV